MFIRTGGAPALFTSLYDQWAQSRSGDAGSVLSLIGGVKVRIITAEVTVTCHDGTSYGGS